MPCVHLLFIFRNNSVHLRRSRRVALSALTATAEGQVLREPTDRVDWLSGHQVTHWSPPQTRDFVGDQMDPGPGANKSGGGAELGRRWKRRADPLRCRRQRPPLTTRGGKDQCARDVRYRSRHESGQRWRALFGLARVSEDSGVNTFNLAFDGTHVTRNFSESLP